MGNFALGFKALFRIWGDPAFAEKVEQLLEGKPQPSPVEPAVKPAPQPPEPKKPVRSDAFTLLAVLQRDARFVDFIKEPIAAYTDAQIGAAVRGVHNDCAAALERMFAIAPMRTEPEGA